jgi:hypothetical protein
VLLSWSVIPNRLIQTGAHEIFFRSGLVADAGFDLNGWFMTQIFKSPHGRPLHIQAQQQHIAIQ